MGVDYKTFSEKPTLVTGILDRILDVACGYRHTLILSERGSVYGMGTNRRFELGLISQSPQTPKSLSPIKIQSLDLHNIVKVRAGNFSAALTYDQEILIWGTGEFGQVQAPIKVFSDGIRFRDIAIGKGRESFAAAIDIDGFLYAWGDN